MTKFIIRKLLIMSITVFLISLAVFFIITLPPGDFMTNYVGRMLAAGERVNQESIDALREAFESVMQTMEDLGVIWDYLVDLFKDNGFLDDLADALENVPSSVAGETLGDPITLKP